MSDQNRSPIVFIGLLRVVAALGVVWYHLVTLATEALGMPWGPCQFVDRYVCGPLGVMERFGFFGVVVFFLISGFIITHVALREDRLTFAVKRVFRIYPPMVASVLVLPLLWSLPRWAAFCPSLANGVSNEDLFYSATLLNYLFPAHQIVSIVTWTLLIETLFYTITFALLPLLKRRPRVAVACELVIVGLLTSKWLAGQGHCFYLLGRYSACLPCLVLGQIIYFTWAGTFRGRDYAVFTALTLNQFVKAHLYFLPHYMQVNCSRFITLAYAYALFVISLHLTDRIRMNAVLRFISESSYSLYLWHSGVGFVVLLYLKPLGAGPALATAFAACFVASYLSWRFVERPSQDAARWLLAKFRPPKKADTERKPEIRLAA